MKTLILVSAPGSLFTATVASAQRNEWNVGAARSTGKFSGAISAAKGRKMDYGKSALERAFELAKEGRCPRGI